MIARGSVPEACEVLWESPLSDGLESFVGRDTVVVEHCLKQNKFRKTRGRILEVLMSLDCIDCNQDVDDCSRSFRETPHFARLKKDTVAHSAEIKCENSTSIAVPFQEVIFLLKI